MDFVRSIDQESLISYPNKQFIGSFCHVGGPRFNPFDQYVVDPGVLGCHLVTMEVERSMSLLQFMDNEGLVPSPAEEMKRKNAIDKLKQIVMDWAKRVAFQRRFPKDHIRAASATILAYGSYGLGVHCYESDLDVLCVGPYFATPAEDFFTVLHDMLASRPEVSEILCVKDARVPLMRFKFDGVLIDLPYAKLNTISPQDMDVLNPHLVIPNDEISWRSLSGVHVNQIIMQLVPDLGVYQSLLRCLKFWAKRRGIYGNFVGFFGGVHLAVLATLICQRNPNAHLSTLVSIFFETFAFWPWPMPVILDESITPLLPNISIERLLMPIQLPSSPNEFCYSNITRSTFYRIRSEFLLGHSLTKDVLPSDFDWKFLFEPFCHVKKYSWFLKICISCSHQEVLGDWVGWVKSRIRCLVVKLEELHGLCDPNPTEFVDFDLAKPHVVFYWGLCSSGGNNLNIDSIREDFMKNIFTGHEGPIGRIELTVVRASELPGVKTRRTKGAKACWRIIDRNHRKIPLYSQHVPQYFVG